MSINTVVLDIEGTTSSTNYVHETLYPYSQQRFSQWIRDHESEARVQEQFQAVRKLTGEADADADRIVWWLNHWLGGDEKITPLKAFQGWIWQEGFACKDLVSHFFDDSIPAIKRWHEQGKKLYIFSSGSVTAQHAWFGNSPDGDLLPLFSGHFDTENLGPKKVKESYQLIAENVGSEASNIVFLSDLVDELDAARAAGWHTVGVRREGDQYFDAGVGDHLAVFTFEGLDLDGEQPKIST